MKRGLLSRFGRKKDFKKWVISLLVILLLIASINAAVFISVQTDSQLTIPEDIHSLQLMAADWNHDGRRVLQRDGDRLKLDLGEWSIGESKTYPAAFAIVNPAERGFTITDISLRAEPENLRMYLHQNMTKPCNEEYVNVEKTENEENHELIYNEGYVDKENQPIHFEWELAPGDGMTENELTYSNGTEIGTAEKENDVWVHDPQGPREAVQGEANFVWVEMSVFSKEGDDTATHRGPIEIEIDGEFEDPQPNVAFMGSGRRDGGPVIRALEGNTIELNVTDLKENRTVVISDAFAIVNAGPTELNITDIKVEGDEHGFMRVWLHSDPNKLAGDYDLDLGREDEDNRTLYYDGESTHEDEWTLGEGFGYTEENGNLLYGKEGDQTTATRTAGYPTAEYNLWMYDEEANNIAEKENSNFVWVEIAYVMEELPEESIDVHSTITFQFSSA